MGSDRRLFLRIHKLAEVIGLRCLQSLLEILLNILFRGNCMGHTCTCISGAISYMNLQNEF
jgi:hypothetical protein